MGGTIITLKYKNRKPYVHIHFECFMCGHVNEWDEFGRHAQWRYKGTECRNCGAYLDLQNPYFDTIMENNNG